MAILTVHFCHRSLSYRELQHGPWGELRIHPPHGIGLSCGLHVKAWLFLYITSYIFTLQSVFSLYLFSLQVTVNLHPSTLARPSRS